MNTAEKLQTLQVLGLLCDKCYPVFSAGFSFDIDITTVKNRQLSQLAACLIFGKSLSKKVWSIHQYSWHFNAQKNNNKSWPWQSANTLTYGKLRTQHSSDEGLKLQCSIPQP